MLRRIIDFVRGRLARSSGDVERSYLRNYPHDFDAPSEILLGLRRVDATADLLYLGWGQWMLVSVRPNSEMIQKGVRRLAEARRLLHRWETDPALKQNPGAFRRLYRRYLYWLAVSQGARPIGKYEAAFVRRFGLEAIVTDFRRMDWMHRMATEQAVFDEGNAQYGLDYEKARARRDAHAELRDEYKHLDAFRYLTTTSHSTTRHDDPEKRRHRSGFTTVATIGADGQLRSTA
jgi:hypothetical protein